MKNRKDLLILAFIGMLAGFFVIRVVEAQRPDFGFGDMLTPQSIDQYFEGRSLSRIEGNIRKMQSLELERDRLMEEIWELEEVIVAHEEKAAEAIYKGEEIREELQNNRITAGLTDMEGPGIEIILDDRKKDTILDLNPNLLDYYIVHDSDLLEVVNELRAAGAEAISINGVRIMGSSRISCGGPTINVGKEQRFAPPFIIHAIGDPETLASYFHREDSIFSTLMFWGLRFDIKKMDILQIPRYIGDIDFKYAKPLEAGE